MDNQSDRIIKELNYKHNKDGTDSLYYKKKFTGVTIKRSHEGYSHWAKLYVCMDGKVKKDFTTKEKEQAEYFGKYLFIELISDRLLEKKGG